MPLFDNVLNERVALAPRLFELVLREDMEFNNRSIFKHHVVSKVTKCFGGLCSVGCLIKDNKNINIACESLGFATDGRTEDIQFCYLILKPSTGTVDERFRYNRWVSVDEAAPTISPYESERRSEKREIAPPIQNLSGNCSRHTLKRVISAFLARRSPSSVSSPRTLPTWIAPGGIV